MRRLLIGPAGSGKTHQVLGEFKSSLASISDPLSRDFLFIVPSAEHVERIVSQLFFSATREEASLTGFFHHRVTTFSRLTAEILGTGQENLASTSTRYLILRDILNQNPEGYFAEAKQSPGFSDLMLHFISELKEGCVTPEIFRARMNHLKRLEPDLALKYEELAGIYEAYHQRLGLDGLIDRQDSIGIYRLKKESSGSSHVRYKKIWIDGFFDFTPFQIEALKEVCALTEEVTITLTKDSSASRAALFEGVQPTEDILKELGFKVSPMNARNFRTVSLALTYLEKNVFNEDQPKLKQPDPETAVTIFEAVGVQGEVEMILRQIRQLYASGEYRFSDFVILLRQIGGYEAVIRSLFFKYGIPLEMHERERLKLSGMINAIVLLLKIFREGWKRADIIHFLRSSYVQRVGPCDKVYEWIGEFEHRAYKAGVSEGRENWLKPWGKDKSEFDDAKLKIFQVFAGLEDDLRVQQSFAKLKKRFMDMLYKDFGILQVSDVLSDSVKRDAASARRLEAVLEEIRVHAFRNGRNALSFDDFADEFFRLVDLDLYPVHYEDKNRVQVYDISLARQKEYKVVFVAGLLEKHFPVQIKEDPVLSDWERALFNSEKPVLQERLPRQNLERYLFYVAITRARERLFLTYPRVDREGKEWLPSFYVDEVRSLFSDKVVIRKQDLSHPYPKFEEASMPRELETALVGELWNAQTEDSGLLFDLAVRQLREPKFLKKFEKAVTKIEDRLSDQQIAAGDFFHTRQTSPTRLETYAQCHYRYFADKVMKLKDPRENINEKQKGIIRHQVLEEFFKAALKNPALLEFSKAEKFAQKEFDKALAEFPLEWEKKYQYDLEVMDTRDSLLFFLKKEIERLKTSVLKPRYFEYSFGVSRGKEASDAPALVLKWKGRELAVTGLIDRIDADSENQYGLVMDYKSSAVFKADKLDLGTALQLPVYLEVMEKYLKLKPVGGELYSIKARKLGGFYHEQNSEGILKRRSDNKLSEKEFRETVDRSMHFIKRFVDEMSEMNIEVKPRECLRFCSFAPVCRIQKWKLPMMLEEIKEADQKWLKDLKPEEASK